MTLWKELQARGLYYQCTNEEALEKILETEKIFVYVGVDPTGESLHLGHLVPLLTLCHFGRYGHTPIILIGGGTARVGDPSGKTETRPLLSENDLRKNITKIETQIRTIMGKFDIDPIFVNNANWLNNLKYIDFIRDIGCHFSINRMLSFDTYKTRLEKGLSFLEFNYQLLQAYDYLYLYKHFDCTLQVGGADQWANIIAGNDIIRRIHQVETYGYTLPIITRSDGSKMGKSEKGALFIDSTITSPYNFYQYLRNTPDLDVIKFLKQYTFLDLTHISSFEKCVGEQLNPAKELLAYTLTEFIHGKNIAQEIREAANAVFYGVGTKDSIPSYTINADALETLSILELYVKTGLCASKTEARRLIEQGGARMNNLKIVDIDFKGKISDFTKNEAILSAGKKTHIRLLLV